MLAACLRAVGRIKVLGVPLSEIVRVSFELNRPEICRQVASKAIKPSSLSRYGLKYVPAADKPAAKPAEWASIAAV